MVPESSVSRAGVPNGFEWVVPSNAKPTVRRVSTTVTIAVNFFNLKIFPGKFPIIDVLLWRASGHLDHRVGVTKRSNRYAGTNVLLGLINASLGRGLRAIDIED